MNGDQALLGCEARPAGLLDDAGVVQLDLPCLRCSYNLRGLAEGANCPECGLPLARSIRGDFLAYADPAYVETLARGARVLPWSLGMLVLSILCGIFCGIALAAAAPDAPSGFVLFMIGMLVAGLGMLAAFLLFVCGAIWITSRQPGRLVPPKEDRRRLWTRLALAAVVLNWLFGIAVAWMQLSSGARLVYALLSLGISILAAIGAAAYFRYLSGLAERISPGSRPANYQMSKTARVLGYWFAAALSIQVIENALEVVLMLSIATGGQPTAGALPAGGVGMSPLAAFPAVACLNGISKLLILILLLAAVRLHNRLRQALRLESALARGEPPVATAPPAQQRSTPPAVPPLTNPPPSAAPGEQP